MDGALPLTLGHPKGRNLPAVQQSTGDSQTVGQGEPRESPCL